MYPQYRFISGTARCLALGLLCVASVAIAQPVSRMQPDMHAPRALHEVDPTTIAHVQEAPLTADLRAPLPSDKSHHFRDYNDTPQKSAKAVCDIAQFADATPANIVAVVQAATVTCVNENFDAVGAQAAAIFTEAKMVAVANAVAAQSPGYPGNNSTNLTQLIMFLRSGMYVEFYQSAVADFGPAVKQAIAAAIDAFVASPNFDVVNTEHGYALKEIITLLDSNDLGSFHIATMVRILDNYGPGHAASGNMRTAVNNVFVLIYNGGWDPLFTPALIADTNDLPGALSRFILDNRVADVGSTREYLLTNAAAELARLLGVSNTAFHAQVHTAIRALTDSIFSIDYAPGLFLKIAEMVKYYDNAHCADFNTCTALADLELRILPPEHARLCSPTLRVRSQGLTPAQIDAVCDTLSGEEGFFHEVVQSNEIPVANDNNTVLEMVIFNSSTDYERYSGTFFGNSVNNGGIYLEGTPSAAGNQARFIAFVATWITDRFEVWNLWHEYVHYLDGRFNFHGGFGATPMTAPYSAIWYIEGVAEYIAFSYRQMVNADALVQAATVTVPLSTQFDTVYGLSTERIYNWGYLGTRFMFERHRDDITAMYNVTRVGNFAPGYRIWMDRVKNAYDAEFQAWLACYVRDGGDTTACNEEMDRLILADDFEGDDPPPEPEPEPEPEPVDLPECALYERQLGNGCKLSNLQAAASNQVIWLYMHLPANIDTLTIKTQGRYGDVDIYGGYSPLYPSPGNYDHASTLAGNNETMVVASPTPGYYNIRLSPKSDYFAEVTIYATWTLQGTNPDPDPEPEPDPDPTLDECADPLAANQLGNGCQRSNVALNASHLVTWFYVAVPAGVETLTIKTGGGSGDADMYGALGSFPSTTVYDHASTNTGNAETIVIQNPAAGFYNVGLRPKSASFAGVRIYAKWTMAAVDPDPEPVDLPECAAPLYDSQLGNGCKRSGLSKPAVGHQANYYFGIPANIATLSIHTVGGTGDADLYGGRTWPNATTHEAASTNVGNTEVITLTNPAAGDYFVAVTPKSASFANVTLYMTWTVQTTDPEPEPEPEPSLDECAAPLAANQLGNGCQRSNLELTASHLVAWFNVYVPAGVETLTIKTDGGTGDADLYGAYSPLYPTVADHHHASTNVGNSETIVIQTPTAGYYNIGVRPKSASFSGVRLYASWTLQGTDPEPEPEPEPGLAECAAPLAANQLGNDCQRSNVSLAASHLVSWFYIYVPAGVQTLTIKTDGGTGDVDMHGAYSPVYPNTTTYDHASTEVGNAETIVIQTPTAGYYNIGLRPKSASFSGVRIYASWTLQGTDPEPEPEPEPGLAECAAPLNATQLGNGCQRSNVSVAASHLVSWFYVYLPAGVQTLTIKTDGGTGDVDMYGALGAYPTTTVFDHSSTSVGNEETIEIQAPASGYYNIGLRPKSANFSGVRIYASWTLN